MGVFTMVLGFMVFSCCFHFPFLGPFSSEADVRFSFSGGAKYINHLFCTYEYTKSVEFRIEPCYFEKHQP